MFVVALLLLLAAALLVIAALYGAGDRVTFDMGPLADFKTSGTGMFFLGMATLLLAVLALGAFRVGTKRAAQRRRERKKVGELSKQLDEYKREEPTTSYDDETGRR